MKNSNAIREEILGLEKKYWQAMQEHDLKTAQELTDFPCLVAGANGFRSVDEKKFEQMFRSQENEAIADFYFEPKQAEVRLLNPNTAVVAYQIQSKQSRQGKTRDLKAVDTSTWVKRDNKWLCAMHTETELLKQ